LLKETTGLVLFYFFYILIYLLVVKVSLHSALFFFIKDTIPINVVLGKQSLNFTISVTTATRQHKGVNMKFNSFKKV